ncbi:MAG TPA: CADD family putative folate metabolism protein [Candidatus Limnocylindria bacterium]|nr:CADD family putative folate metabolism protein [Candidatus Limnocylindria bacterium]
MTVREGTVLERIDALIAERHLLKHPFYTKWREGTLSREALQEYARQYYAFESTFPRLLSALHTRSEDPAVRQSILDNLWDEEHGEVNHAEMWLRFGEGIGVDRDDVRAASRNDGTKQLLSTYWSAVTDAPLAAGVAALYAYEGQVPEVATEKINGLRDRYGVDDARTLAFFTVHSTLDVEHSGAEREMIASLASSEADEEAAVAATSGALDAWWGFLSAVDA